MTKKIEGWHRRHAVQLAAQLPENVADVLCILELTQQLVEQFLTDQNDRARGAPIKLVRE